MAGWKQKTIPSKTPADLERDLARPRRSVYVYLGQANDPGWRAATSSTGRLAWCTAYLVSDRSAIATQLADWVGDQKPKGIVFGWGDVPHALLSASQANDSLQGVEAIQAANAATSSLGGE